MLNRLKNIFNRNQKHQGTGLGLPSLPYNFYVNKSSFKSENFKKLVNEHFASKIYQLGFKGKDYFFYRENGIYTEILSLWVYRSGGAIQADLLVKFNNITYPPDHTIIKATKLKSTDCEFWKKLSPMDNTEAWFWVFEEETKSNIRLISDIWEVFIKYGIPYFDQFKNHQEYLKKISPKELSNILALNVNQFTIRLLGGGGEISLIYFFMKYWDQQNDKKIAREFALMGIDEKYQEWNTDYREEFQRYINNNS